jgi:carbon-monoxide dehydrogenase large subunit
VYGELALDGDGKFLGLRAKAYQALGAYWWAAITAPLFFSLMLIPSVYDVQAVELSTQAVFTNTAPTSVYRGAGRPEAIYLIERLTTAPRRCPDRPGRDPTPQSYRAVGAALSHGDPSQLR